MGILTTIWSFSRSWRVPSVISLSNVVIGASSAPIGPISLDLDPGDRFILMSPNGAGKSMLLRTLAGQQPALSGVMRKADEVRVGMLAQAHPRARYWPLSGRDWLNLMGSQCLIDPLLADLIHRRVDTLSGGEWQYLRLAAVVGLPVDVILLDEPANHLDAAVWAQSVRLIRECASEKAMLLATHDRQFAIELGFEIRSMQALMGSSS